MHINIIPHTHEWMYTDASVHMQKSNGNMRVCHGQHTCLCACVYAHAYPHAYVHTEVCITIRTWYTHLHIHMHARIHTHSLAHIHIHKYTLAHKKTLTFPHKRKTRINKHKPPAATCVMFLPSKDSITLGCIHSSSLRPWPNWPWPPAPHVMTRESGSNMTVCRLPQLTILTWLCLMYVCVCVCMLCADVQV